MLFELLDEFAACRRHADAAFATIFQGVAHDQTICFQQAGRLTDDALRETGACGDVADRFGPARQGAQDWRVARSVIQAHASVMFLSALIDEFPDVAEQFTEAGWFLRIHAQDNTLALMQSQSVMQHRTLE